GVGASTAALTTNVSNVDGTGGTGPTGGGFFVTNQNALSVLGAGHLGVSAAGDIRIHTTAGSLNVMDAVKSTIQSVELIADSDLQLQAMVTANRDLMAAASQNLMTSSPLTATSGSATLQAVDKIAIGANVSAFLGNLVVKTEQATDQRAITLDG